ncbi:MAG: hypothetical protein H6R43_739 [Nitrospirae bacterium]|nr:hypothetical protein [Nitrospirota bacterium]
MRHLLKFSLLVLMIMLAACATFPTGPSVMSLPGTGKNFDQFRTDDAICRQYAYEQVGGLTGQQAGQDAAVKSAVVGTPSGAMTMPTCSVCMRRETGYLSMGSSASRHYRRLPGGCPRIRLHPTIPRLRGRPGTDRGPTGLDNPSGLTDASGNTVSLKTVRVFIVLSDRIE